MVKIKELIDAEKLLMEYDLFHWVDLSIEDEVKLNQVREEISKYTDTFFKQQARYAEKLSKADIHYLTPNNMDKKAMMEGFHNKKLNEEVDYDIEGKLHSIIRKYSEKLIP